MENLLKIAKPDLPKLARIVRHISGSHLTSLSEPCFYPEHKVYYFEILNACNLTNDDIKNWLKGYWKGMPQAKWKLQNDPGIMLTIFLMYLFLKEKDILSYDCTMIYFVIRFYSNAMHHFIPYCNIDVFRYTLDHLTKTHLFVREGTISGALRHLAKEMTNKYTQVFKTDDKLRISKFIQECRGRVSQSCESFRDMYYINAEEGKKYSTPWETPEGEEVITPTVENVERIADEIARRITVYGEINVKNLGEAQKLTKISGAFASDIAKQVSIPEHKEDVKLIIELFLRELRTVRQICGKEFFILVTSLLSVKRTTKQIYFKKQVSDLLLKVLRQSRQEKKFLELTRQTQFGAITFLALYIMLFARQTLCPER